MRSYTEWYSLLPTILMLFHSSYQIIPVFPYSLKTRFGVPDDEGLRFLLLGYKLLTNVFSPILELDASSFVRSRPIYLLS